MTTPNHVLVIGAGIAGLSTAWYLNREGVKVTVVEKGDGTDNCSYGNAGMIVPSHVIPLASPGMISKGFRWMFDAESPFYIKPRFSTDLLYWGWKFRQASTRRRAERAGPVLRDLLLKTRKLYIEMEEEGLDFTFHKNGLLMLCNSEKGLQEERESVERARELAMPAEMLSAAEVAAMEPGLQIDILGAAYFPLDGHLYPKRVMDSMKSRLKQQGVRFRWNTEITGFVTEDRGIHSARTSDGNQLEADRYVICTGAWTAGLARELDLRLPLLAGKGYSITLDKPPRLPRNIAILSEAKVTCTPLDGKLRFGGTMELTGTDRSVTRSRMEGLKKSVTHYLPDFETEDLEGHEVWAGLRPCSPDGLPYVGRVNGLENCYLSTGHAMMGMSLGPSSGKMIADLIKRGESRLYHPLIDPNRYQKKF